MGKATGTFGGLTITIGPVETHYGWLEVYVEGGGQGQKLASWFDDSPEKKDCWVACPMSFFMGLFGMFLAIAVIILGLKRIKDETDSAKLARVQFVVSTVCMVCGVIILLAFGVGCYNTVDVSGGALLGMEKSLGGGYITAILATFLSIPMMILDFMTWKQK